MEKQSAHLLKGHLIRSAFYLVLLLAVCVIPFALGQRNSNKQSVATKPNIAVNTNPAVAAERVDIPSFTGAAGVSAAHKASLEGPKPSSGSIGVHRSATLSTPQVVPHDQPSLSAASTTPTPTATPTQCQLRVLLVHTELSGPPTAIHDQIAREQGVTQVEFWDAGEGHGSTPTLQVLQQYDIVFAFDAGGVWNDPLAMGNVLADYEDGGGVVVVGDIAWYNFGHDYLEGRWMFDAGTITYAAVRADCEKGRDQQQRFYAS
jgi:hypothetical protein